MLMSTCKQKRKVRGVRRVVKRVQVVEGVGVEVVRGVGVVEVVEVVRGIRVVRVVEIVRVVIGGVRRRQGLGIGGGWGSWRRAESSE